MKGEENPHSTLTPEQVKYIRENPDGILQKDMAVMFGVNESCIEKLCRPADSEAGAQRKETNDKQP